MGATLYDRPTGPLTEADIAGAGDTRYWKRTETPLIAATDLNTLLIPGSYACADNSCTNGPYASGQWYITVARYAADTTYILQTATDLIGNPGIWHRVRVAGTFSVWFPVIMGGQAMTGLTDSLKLGALGNLGIPVAQGRMEFVSTTAIKFAPYNGDLVKIAGLLYRIPAAGIAGIANTSVFVNGTGASNLAASTMYYVYAFSNGGTVTADFRTDGNGHLPSDTAGNIGTEVRVSAGTTKDDSRTLIGMVRTNASSQFAATTTRSWFNRKTKTNTGAIASSTTTSSTSLVELSSNARVDFLCWAGEEVEIRIQSQLANGTSAQDVTTNIGLDGGTTPQLAANVSARVSAVTGTGAWFGSGTAAISPSEGYHFINNLVQVSGGTGTYNNNVMQVRMD